tara:strand:- start:66 stop:293 length:228 start_codon:yes stop_codon:yes gene_type:complete
MYLKWKSPSAFARLRVRVRVRMRVQADKGWYERWGFHFPGRVNFCIKKSRQSATMIFFFPKKKFRGWDRVLIFCE